MIEGHCADDFASVRDALWPTFTERGELGATVTVIVKGEAVVHLWGGWADRAHTRRWTWDTLVNAYSPGGVGHHGTAHPSASTIPPPPWGYVMNHVVPRWQSPRNQALVDAVYRSL
ncbi:hypothetical protein BH23ACT2_BH23ACT2_02330 [soil metagenome]